MRVEAVTFVCDLCGGSFEHYKCGLVLGIEEFKALTGKDARSNGNCFDFCERCWGEFVGLFKALKAQKR